MSKIHIEVTSWQTGIQLAEKGYDIERALFPGLSFICETQVAELDLTEVLPGDKTDETLVKDQEVKIFRPTPSLTGRINN